MIGIIFQHKISDLILIFWFPVFFLNRKFDVKIWLLWSKITNKFGFGKVSRKCINVSDVTKTLGGHSGSSGDKSIEDLSKRKGTLENYERKFKETYESPSSQFRTKKLKEIGNEIKTINTTFSKRTRRGRIRKILEKN